MDIFQWFERPENSPVDLPSPLGKVARRSRDERGPQWFERPENSPVDCFQWFERLENSPVDCFQRERAGRPPLNGPAGPWVGGTAKP